MIDMYKLEEQHVRTPRLSLGLTSIFGIMFHTTLEAGYLLSSRGVWNAFLKVLQRLAGLGVTTQTEIKTHEEDLEAHPELQTMLKEHIERPTHETWDTQYMFHTTDPDAHIEQQHKIIAHRRTLHEHTHNFASHEDLVSDIITQINRVNTELGQPIYTLDEQPPISDLPVPNDPVPTIEPPITVRTVIAKTIAVGGRALHRINNTHISKRDDECNTDNVVHELLDQVRQNMKLIVSGNALKAHNKNPGAHRIMLKPFREHTHAHTDAVLNEHIQDTNGHQTSIVREQNIEAQIEAHVTDVEAHPEYRIKLDVLSTEIDALLTT